MKAFVTVGLDRKPFNRLLELVDQGVASGLLSRDSLVQSGHTVYSPKNFTAVDFISFPEMVKAIEEAELVITHAGVGSVMLCLNVGQMPLVMPREGDRGEHVDNHQVEFAEVMAATGKVMAAYNGNDFFNLLSKARQWRNQASETKNRVSESELVKTLKDLLNTIN